MSVIEKYRVLVLGKPSGPRDGEVRNLVAEDSELEFLSGSITGKGTFPYPRTAAPDLILVDLDDDDAGWPEYHGSTSLTRRPVIIAVSSNPLRSLTAFQLHAVDFVTKPVQKERLQDAFRWAKAEARLRRGAEERSPDPDRAGELPASRPVRILLKGHRHLVPVRSDEIDWVEAQGGYVCIHAPGRKHLVRGTISHMERQLPPASFVRIHRSFIVNLDSVTELQPGRFGSCVVVLYDGTRLVMSRSFRRTVFRRFVKPN